MLKKATASSKLPPLHDLSDLLRDLPLELDLDEEVVEAGGVEREHVRGEVEDEEEDGEPGAVGAGTEGGAQALDHVAHVEQAVRGSLLLLDIKGLVASPMK